MRHPYFRLLGRFVRAGRWPGTSRAAQKRRLILRYQYLQDAGMLAPGGFDVARMYQEEGRLDVAVAVKERARDREKQEFTWVDAKIVQEFPKGHELHGYKIAYLDDPADTAQLGQLMHHCSGTHFIWTSEERIWYFFTILGPNGQPHCTLHAKQKKWLNTPHPRDVAKRIPFSIPRMGGGYPCFADVLAAFKRNKAEYEPGIYGPPSPSLTSCVYDRGAAEREYDNNNWDDLYYRCSVIPAKPEGVSQDIWDAYTKNYKAMRDQYDKAKGTFRINGREFRFDGKLLTVLSLSFNGQSLAGGNAYRKAFHEWFIDLNRKKKEEKPES